MEWSKEEIYEFDRLVEDTGSHDQVTRINARMDMSSFIEKHGKDKCDAMWKHLQSGGAIEPYKDKDSK